MRRLSYLPRFVGLKESWSHCKPLRWMSSSWSVQRLQKMAVSSPGSGVRLVLCRILSPFLRAKGLSRERVMWQTARRKCHLIQVATWWRGGGSGGLIAAWVTALGGFCETPGILAAVARLSAVTRPFEGIARLVRKPYANRALAKRAGPARRQTRSLRAATSTGARAAPCWLALAIRREMRGLRLSPTRSKGYFYRPNSPKSPGDLWTWASNTEPVKCLID